jgi:glycosyltransferase involved in cell wall biosynthesis
MAAIASLFDHMTLVITRGKPRAGGIPLPAGAEVVALDEPVGADLRRKLSVIWRLPGLARKINEQIQRADVVHTPVPGDIAFLGMVMALVKRKKLIARYCGSWTVNSRTSTMNRVTSAIMRRFAGGRNVMLATGLADQRPARNMHWVFTTALTQGELDDAHPDLDKTISTQPRIASIGRLSPEKGFEILLRAGGLLKRRGFSPLPLVRIMGDGPERARLEQIAAQEDVIREVTFLGQLNRQQMATELGAADFAVQPSLTESLRKAWLDAFAYGLPVIGTQVGAARAVIGENCERGWIVPAGDADALAEQITRAIQGPVDWPAMRRRSRAYVDGLTLEAWARRIGEISAAQWRMRLLEGKLRP